MKRINPLKLKRMAAEDAAVAHLLSLSPSKQEIKHFRRESAADAAGTLQKGQERYIFSKGQFSVIEMLFALTEQTGPVHSIISTWTAAGGDIAEAYALLQSGRLLSTKWCVDFTFQRRRPHFCGQLRELFGPEALRVTRTHAKFICLWNEEWQITVFTSANLNHNPRNENFLIRESAELVEFHREYVRQLFEKRTAEDAMQPSAAAHIRQYNEE